MHDLLDILQGNTGGSFIDKVHPIGVYILLTIGGLLTGLHITAICTSIGYTILCSIIKWKEYKKNINNEKNKTQ